MTALDTLIEAAARVDVIDAAGRIIANPRRAATGVSTAEALALACAAEKFWAICLEAEVLVRALQRPITGNDANNADRDHIIQTQIDEITKLMAALRGEGNNNG